MIKIQNSNTLFILDLVGTRKTLLNIGFYVVEYFVIFPFNKKINRFLWQVSLISTYMEVMHFRTTETHSSS
jgi:hypothetical protein